MPDAKDKVTPASQPIVTTAEDMQRELREIRILLWFHEHSRDGNGSCPVCGKVEWIVAPNLVQPLAYLPGEMTPFMPSRGAYPLAMLTCNNCGQVLFFNAVIMGLVKAQDAE